MTVYDYVATSNPQASANLIRSYGYDMYKGSDLGDNLREMVAQNGESALVAILDIHPDKEVILEAFNKAEETSSCGCKKGNCTCKKDNYLNASGVESARTEMVVASSNQQTNTFLLAAALLLSVAIITRK